VDLADVSYDPKTQLVTLQASLRNRSKEPIRGRLTARVVSVSSENAGVSIANSDNGASGPGSIFDFTTLLTDGVLAPEKSSKPKTIQLKLSNVRVPRVDEKETWKALQLALFDLDFLVLGEAEKPEKPEKPEKK
jgi:hypothetical protein